MSLIVYLGLAVVQGAPAADVTLVQVRRLYDMGDPLEDRHKGTAVEKQNTKASELTKKFGYVRHVIERVSVSLRAESGHDYGIVKLGTGKETSQLT